MPTVPELLDAAMALSDADRAELAELLTATLPDDPSTLHPAWAAELRRRAAEVESGKVQCVPWEEVERRAQSILDGKGKLRG